MVVEFVLPFWIDACDVRVDFGEEALEVHVRNTLRTTRTFWRNRCTLVCARARVCVCLCWGRHCGLRAFAGWSGRG